MIVPQYLPGEWLAVVTDGTIALLPPDTGRTLLAELWASIRDGAGLMDHLQVLLRPGIADLPPFALVSVEGGRVHAVVRGQVAVEVTTATETRVLSAAHVSTWAEEVVADAHLVQVRVGAGAERAGGAPGSEHAQGLPVLAAVVRVSGVRVELRPRTTPVPVSPTGIQPVVAPASAPVSPVSPVAPVAAPAGAWTPSLVAAPPAAEPAADRPDPQAAPADASSTPSEDHDGLTVLSSDVVSLRRELPEWAGDAVPALSVPTQRTPPPAKLLMSSGLTVSLNRPVLLGRAPQVARVVSTEIPRLVTVASPNQDISRTHAEARMEGEHVVVTDLRSTNGVLLLRQGSSPQRLHPGEPTVVEPGVVVDLGEGVTFIVEAGA